MHLRARRLHRWCSVSRSPSSITRQISLPMRRVGIKIYSLMGVVIRCRPSKQIKATATSTYRHQCQSPSVLKALFNILGKRRIWTWNHRWKTRRKSTYPIQRRHKHGLNMTKNLKEFKKRKSSSKPWPKSLIKTSRTSQVTWSPSNHIWGRRSPTQDYSA